MKCPTIIPQKKELPKRQTHLRMSAVELLFSALLVCSLVFLPFSSSKSETQEIVTGQETSPNVLPSMSVHTRSGGTRITSGQGCATGKFCTAGKQGPGGFFTSTFDLQDNMSIDQINRGFDLDYGMDVRSHPSNATLSSCVGGNVMQNDDCRDIFKLTVSLFNSGSILAHKFEHEVELDFSGTKTYSFSQIIPQNEFSALTGEFEMFGIDAGFPNKFFGPRFSNPTLTTTYDLVTLIETEIIDIISTIDMTPPNEAPISDVEVEVETPTGEVINVELEINDQISVELETTSLAPPVMEAPVEPTQEVEVNIEVETEMQDANTESGTNTQNEPEPEPESTTETEPTEQEGESSVEESTETETTEVRATNEEEVEEESPRRATPEVKKKEIAQKVKEKVAKKIMKKMGDKGRYDSTNQLRTLVVMQVLGNTKSFFSAQKMLPDTQGFFTNTKIPDATISDNNYNQYFLFGGSDARMDALTDSQYRR